MNKSERKILRIQKKLDRAQTVCGEIYQVLGSLSYYAGVFHTRDIEKALDNLSHGSGNGGTYHHKLLPWPRDPRILMRLESQRLRNEKHAKKWRKP